MPATDEHIGPKASRSFAATTLRLAAAAALAEAIAPAIEARSLPAPGPDEVVVAVEAAGVNPSDVKAALGLMPSAVFPRTPGRDFAGTVIDGPGHLVGRPVFGSSGDLGIRRDGTHATHLVIEADAVVERPSNLTVEEAAGIGVPFVTAMEGLCRAGLPRPGETVLVMGANGKVGQAAIQIATWQGANAIGVVRRAAAYEGHASASVAVIDASREDVPARVRALTGGRGADIVFNTVGEPYYAAVAASMAKLGRQIFIASIHRAVEFDLFAFYRGRHTYLGIDTLALSSIDSAQVLRGLTPGFASGDLKPFPIRPEAVHTLRAAAEAYRAVIGSTRDRVILQPGI